MSSVKWYEGTTVQLTTQFISQSVTPTKRTYKFMQRHERVMQLSLFFPVLTCLLVCLVIVIFSWATHTARHVNNNVRPEPTSTATITYDILPVDEVWTRHVITRPNAGSRLGNQMFQYASLLGIAATNKMTPIYRRGLGSTLDRTFENLFAIENAKQFKQTTSRVVIVRECSNPIYDLRFERLHEMKTRDVFIQQYFQSWKYFHRISSRVREAFTFRRSYVETVERFLRESSSELRSSVQRPLFVGVHIRRTDWVAHMPNHDVGGQDYLLKAVKIFYDKLSLTDPDRCVIYVVCSDDQTWARANFPSVVNNVTASYALHSSNRTTSAPTCEPKVVYSRGRSASEDMALLAACNHTIITVGTYGWWGAWLAGGITIAFSKYPPFSSQLGANLEDYYPPGWITVS